jgi:Na+/glutamate symporter
MIKRKHFDPVKSEADHFDQSVHYSERRTTMPEKKKRKTFSTMEIVLICVLLGSLILSFLQARHEEKQHT